MGGLPGIGAVLPTPRLAGEETRASVAHSVVAPASARPRARVCAVLGETWPPSFSSSPAIRGWPQRGFSRARRRTSSRTRRSTGGRPAGCLGSVHFGGPALGAGAAASAASRSAAPISRREHPAERGEQSAIGWLQRRSRLLAPKHCELMPQNKQLDVLGELAVAATHEQPPQRREREIGEGEEHPPMLPEPAAADIESRT